MTPEQLSKNPANLKLMWEKARDIYRELKVTGLSDVAIAGILGNMAQESSFISNKKGGSHVGYVQNEPRIIEWITQQFGGYNHKHQMNYLIAGLTNKLPDITSVMGSDLNNRFNTFVKGVQNINDVPSAVKLWETAYEKSNGQQLQARINYGNYFYNKILEEGDALQPQEYGPVYSPQGDLSIYLPTSTEDDTYAKQALNSIHEYQLHKQKNLPKIPYKRGYKSGGKLIKRGQQGMQVFKSPNNPYNVEIQLEKDPLPKGYIEPNNVRKYGYYDITPEERMDQTVQQLSSGLSTYKPTKDQKDAGTHTKQPFGWQDAVGTIPLFVATAPFLLEGIKLAGAALLSNPIGTATALGKDIIGYTAADAVSQKLTGQGISDNLNDALYLPKGHPIGELAGFTGTSLLRRPLEKAGKAAYRAVRGAIQPEYALSKAMNQALYEPYISRVVGENGKIRLRLPSHSDKMPREIVLEPQENNQFYVHVRTWNDVDGKVPANLTSREIEYLYEALYNELPDGAEILFPKSGPGNYATRGTVAGLQRLARDPRYIEGTKGKLLYIDKDGSIKKFKGTSFLKKVTRTNEDYVTRQLIPFAQQQGNWVGHNNVTSSILDNIIPFNDATGSLGGEFTGTRDTGRILLNTGVEKDHIDPILVHEIRHAYDYWPKYQTTGRGNPIIRLLGMDPRDMFSSQNQAIRLTKQQLKLLNKAYPHTFKSLLKGWIQGNDFYRISEKTAVNAELRKMFDDYFIEKYNKAPSVEELNTFIQELSDTELFKILGKMFYRSPYMDAYLRNISKSIPGASPRVKINVYPKTDSYPALNIGVRESVLKSDQLKLIRQALTSVPSAAGVGYGIYNMQQTQ